MIIQGKDFVICRVDERNIEEILHVYQQCEDFLSLGPVPYASRQMILADLELSKEEGGNFCGIYVNGEMVGVVDFVMSNYEGNPSHAYLSLLMISKGKRGIGLGSAVVKTVEEEILKNSSVTSILSGVQVNNESSIAFWCIQGYKIVGGPELLPDKTTVFHLRKDI